MEIKSTVCERNFGLTKENIGAWAILVKRAWALDKEVWREGEKVTRARADREPLVVKRRMLDSLMGWRKRARNNMVQIYERKVVQWRSLGFI
ncbi:hypothetical protein NL676_005225 [Syzygium grande]|nr:hypothetical protein NL676_005225 [Syzygium grande]